VVCLLAGAIAATASGCGTDADRSEARAATERFYAAVQDHDGPTACAQMSPQLRARLVKDEQEPTCAEAVTKLSLRGRRAAAVRVYATAAQVDLAGGDTVFLGDTREGWRLEAVGCRRQGSGPFECEEEA
jgi:hypothetical protein